MAILGATAYGVSRWAMQAFSYQLEPKLRGSRVGVTLLAPFEVDFLTSTTTNRTDIGGATIAPLSHGIVGFSIVGSGPLVAAR